MLALVSTFRSCQMGRSQGYIMKTDIVSILLLRNIIISKMMTLSHSHFFTITLTFVFLTVLILPAMLKIVFKSFTHIIRAHCCVVNKA